MGKLPSGEFVKIMNELKGTKILLLGNHDKNMMFYLKHGFSVVLQNASIKICNQIVTLSHYPLIGVKREDTSMYKGREHENWYKETEFKELALHDYDQFHLHAHLHSSNGGRSKVIEGKQWDIGVDGNNYTPVSIKQVSSWMDKFKNMGG